MLKFRMQLTKWPRTFRNRKSALALRVGWQLQALLYQSDDLIRKISKTIAGKYRHPRLHDAIGGRKFRRSAVIFTNNIERR